MIKAGCLLALAMAAVILIGISAVLSVGAVDASGSDDWALPVRGAVISQPFGCTTVTIEPYSAACTTKHFHSGVDLAISAGAPIHATFGGTAHVISSATGFGLHVVIDHGNGLQSLYGHMQSVSIGDGESVSAGDVIGTVGSTGNSTGPHLHFEIDRDGIPEDPQLDLRLP